MPGLCTMLQQIKSFTEYMLVSEINVCIKRNIIDFLHAKMSKEMRLNYYLRILQRRRLLFIFRSVVSLTKPIKRVLGGLKAYLRKNMLKYFENPQNTMVFPNVLASFFITLFSVNYISILIILYRNGIIFNNKLIIQKMLFLFSFNYLYFYYVIFIIKSSYSILLYYYLLGI